MTTPPAVGIASCHKAPPPSKTEEHSHKTEGKLRTPELDVSIQNTQLPEIFQRLATWQSYFSATQYLAFQADGQLIMLIWHLQCLALGSASKPGTPALQERLQRCCRLRPTQGYPPHPAEFTRRGVVCPRRPGWSPWCKAQTMQKWDFAAVFI